MHRVRLVMDAAQPISSHFDRQLALGSSGLDHTESTCADTYAGLKVMCQQNQSDAGRLEVVAHPLLMSLF